MLLPSFFLFLAAGGGLPSQISRVTEYFDAGDYRAAEDVLKHAEQPEPGSVAEAGLLNAWGGLHLVTSRLAEAGRELSEALTILRRHPERRDLLATVLQNLSGVDTRMGRYAEALDHGMEALRLREAELSPHHPELIRSRGNVATIQYLYGRPQEAHDLLRLAIASARVTYDAGDQRVADLLVSDSLILDKLKRKKEATAARRQARQIRAGRGPAENPNPAIWNAREAMLPDNRVAIRTR